MNRAYRRIKLKEKRQRNKMDKRLRNISDNLLQMVSNYFKIAIQKRVTEENGKNYV